MSWYVDIQYGNVKKNGLVLLSTCSVWHFLQLLNGKPFSSLIKPKNPIIEWVKCIPYHLSLRISLSFSLSLSLSSPCRLFPVFVVIFFAYGTIINSFINILLCFIQSSKCVWIWYYTPTFNISNTSGVLWWVYILSSAVLHRLNCWEKRRYFVENQSLRDYMILLPNSLKYPQPF